MRMKLREIAAFLNGSLLGNAELDITGAAALADAGESDITFAVPPHLEHAAQTRAAAVIIPDTVTEFSKPAIRVSDPRVAFARLLERFAVPLPIERGVHSAAVLGRNVAVGKNTAVMAYAVIADNAVIGDNAVIYPHTYIGHNSKIGDDTILYPNVTVREDCVVGNRVIIHSGAVLGSDGFGFVTNEGRHQKVPQLGNVVIEDDVEIGANVTIDRATMSSTVVKRGTKIDNLVHLAHNVVIGENCYLVAQTGIAGSTIVGSNVTFAGQSGCTGHITIEDNCTFAAKSGIISDVKAGSFYGGFPARPQHEWLKNEAAVGRVPDLIRKVRTLENRLKSLEAKDNQ